MLFNTGMSGKTVLLGAAALIAAGSLHAAGPAQPPPTVGTEVAAPIQAGAPKNYVARTEAYAVVEIVARVSGEMKKEVWKEGGEVKAGQLLYSIEDTVYQANVLAAKANVDSAKASIDQIKAELTFAQNEYNREKQLYDKKASSESKFQDKLRAFNTCKARLSAAEASLKASEAALKLAQNDLSYTKIYSPIKGRIGGSIYSSGNYITPAKGTLAVVVQYDPIKLRFAMSEADFLHYKKNSSLSNLKMEIFGADGQRIERKAKLDFVDNRADTDTGTVMIQFLVDNPDGVLTPDGYATVRISENFAKPPVAVSVSALVIGGSSDFRVFVVGKDNTVELRKVKTGATVGDKIIVTEGLAEGETVVSRGLHKVQKAFKIAQMTKAPVKVNPVPAGRAE
jgi:RND family efflux transporter MFP subunit